MLLYTLISLGWVVGCLLLLWAWIETDRKW